MPLSKADALHNLCADFYSAIAARSDGTGYEPSFATFDDGHRLVQLVEVGTAREATA